MDSTLGGAIVGFAGGIIAASLGGLFVFLNARESFYREASERRNKDLRDWWFKHAIEEGVEPVLDYLEDLEKLIKWATVYPHSRRDERFNFTEPTRSIRRIERITGTAHLLDVLRAIDNRASPPATIGQIIVVEESHEFLKDAMLRLHMTLIGATIESETQAYKMQLDPRIQEAAKAVDNTWAAYAPVSYTEVVSGAE